MSRARALLDADSMDKTLVTAIYDTPVAAARMLDRLLERGFHRDQVTVLMGEEVHRQLDRAGEVAGGDEPAHAAKAGAIAGGTLAVLAAAALSLTGIGLVAIGPLAAMLGAGTLGAVGGGVLGSLVGLGVRGDVARVYERDLSEGAVLLGVEIEPAEADAVETALQDGGGHDLARIDRVT